MKRFSSILILVSVAVTLIVAFLYFVPSATSDISEKLCSVFYRVTNCGGNSAMMANCKGIAGCLMVAQMESTNNFPVSRIIESAKTEIAAYARFHSNSGERFLVRKILPANFTPKMVIVVCDKAYDNVPQPTIWNLYHKNPAHAVGYSDGSVGLISPAEFKKLDLSGFIDSTQLATNAATSTNQRRSL